MKKLRNFLNWTALIEIIAIVILIIINIWITDEWVNNLIYSDIVLLLVTFGLYWLLYLNNDNEECETEVESEKSVK